MRNVKIHSHTFSAMFVLVLWLGHFNFLMAEETLQATNRAPHIRPDYNNIVIPPNIAPLNFSIEEPGTAFQAHFTGANGGHFSIETKSSALEIPLNNWRELLEKNQGTNIEIIIEVKTFQGGWTRFEKIQNAVAPEKIDSHLAYRLLGPICVWFRDVGIYQRNLENYDESPILQSKSILGGCINCHSFQNNQANLLSFQVRPGMDKKLTAPGMVFVRDGKASWLETKSESAPTPPGYHCWNPNAPVVAFSMSKPDQIFRGAGHEIRDVFDYRSDIATFNLNTRTASTSPDISNPEHMETFPYWSADGTSLYYSSAKTPWGSKGDPSPDMIANTKYDLMRIAFNITNNTWGKPEMLVSSAETGKSCLEPRASPDGQFVLFCMTDYGGFPIHQSGCDLYLLDLKTGHYRRLECNSNQADTWHCWSSNSRWFVFSSKRDNGLLARPYFCYVDASGKEHKPFVLPQKDPAFYDKWLKTYNVPELITGKVTVTQKQLTEAILEGFKTAHRQ
jgi:hypothetical protein